MAFIIWNDAALPALTGRIFPYASIPHVVKIEREGAAVFQLTFQMIFSIVEFLTLTFSSLLMEARQHVSG